MNLLCFGLKRNNEHKLITTINFLTCVYPHSGSEVMILCWMFETVADLRGS